MRLRAAIAVAALASCAAGCRAVRDRPVETSIPADIALKIPADAMAVGGADLNQARAAGLDEWLPASVVKDTKQVYAAWNGREVTILERGGAIGVVRHSELLHRAQIAAAGSLLWAVGRGSAIPPLPGNAANVTTLLKNANWVSVSVRRGSDVLLDIAADCADAETARRIEETARASFAMAAAAESKKPAIAATLKAVRIDRAGSTARLRLETTAAGLSELIRAMR